MTQLDFKEATEINEKSEPETDEQMYDRLKKDKSLVLSVNGLVIEMPQPNKKCSCGSKKVYKKCGCSNGDRLRTQEFIESM